MVDIEETQDGVRMKIKVQPRSSASKVVGWSEGMLKVRLTAPPVEGEANMELIELLASFFGVAKKMVSLVRGEKSRTKVVGIAGLSKEKALAIIRDKTSG